MPRKRNSRKEKQTEGKLVKLKDGNMPKSLQVSKQEYKLEDWALSIQEGFMKANESIIAVAYRIPSGDIGNEDIMTKYKSEARDAVANLGREKGLTISVQHIHFKALPLGSHTLMKAYAEKKNAIESRMKKKEERDENDPFAWNVEVN